MLDFAYGYPIQTRQPSPGQLNPQDMQPIQVRGFGTSGTGALIGNIVGDDYVSVPSMRNLFSDGLWGYQETRKVETNAEHQDLLNFLAAKDGGREDSATALGLAFEPTRWMIIRQLFNKNPLQRIEFADSEITPDILAQDAKKLEELTGNEDPNTIAQQPAGQMTPAQQEIQRLTNKLAYAKAVSNINEKLGFNWWDWFTASDPLKMMSLLGSDNAAVGNSDVVRMLGRYDPNFKPEDLWSTIPPLAQQGLLEHGIDESLIKDSPNAEHAKFRLSNALIQSNTQRRLDTYKPTTWDWFKNKGAGFVGMGVDSPVGAALIGGAATEAAVSALVALAPEGILVAGGEATGLGTTLTTAGRAAQLYKLPLYMAPEYMAGTTLIGRAASHFLSFGIAGTLGEYSKQSHDIAFASATMNANPYSRTEIDTGEIALEGFYSGAEGALIFGLGFGALGSVVGAFKNRYKGVLLDPKTGQRNPFDKRWTFESTTLGNTIDLFTKENKDLSILDRSPVNKLKTEAILERKDIKPEDLARESEGMADRAEASKALESGEAAAATPEELETRKLESESTNDYIVRMASNRKIGNIREFVTEVARRDPKDTKVRTQLDTTSEFASMSVQDQIRVLLKSKEHLQTAREMEETSVGLPKERERLYDNLESQRSQWLNRLGKQLTKDEFREIKREILGEKTKRTPLPELLRVANDKAKSASERKAAAAEATAEILERSRAASKSPAMAKVVKQEVPKEVLDAVDVATAEDKLTGTISEGTAQAVKRSILEGVEAPLETGLQKSIRSAVKIAKLSPDRVERIRTIGENHTLFMNVVRGNKTNAFNLYESINEGVRLGVLSPEDRTLILASVAHLNFDLKGFSIKYEYVDMQDVNTAGLYNATTKTLQINTKASGSKRAGVFLHEIGHALFSNDAFGEVYMQNLRLYNSMRESGATRLVDPLTMNLSRYHLQNAEENFVQLFSNVLLAETKKALSPIETSAVRTAFGIIHEALINVAVSLDESKYYNRVNEVIKHLTDVDSEVIRNNVSVATLVKSFASAESEAKTVGDFNMSLRNFIKFKHPNVAEAAIPRFTEGEYRFFFKGSGDTAMLAALAISREAGKPIINNKGEFTEHTGKFLDAYAEYKKAQFNSVTTKVAGILNSMDYKTLIGLSKEERESFLMYNVFDINIDSFDKSAPIKEILAATYEDESLAKMNLNGGNYATDYLLSNADNLVTMLEEGRVGVKTNPMAKPDIKGLSEADRDALISRIEADKLLMKPLIEQVREHFKKAGLEDLLDSAWAKAQKALILRLEREGVFSIEFPEKKRLMAFAVAMIQDKAKLKDIALEPFLRDTLKFDPPVVQQLMKVSGGDTLKAMHALIRGLREDALVHDGNTWSYNLRLAEPEEPVLPSERKLKMLDAGAKLITEEDLNSHLLNIGNKLNDKMLTGQIEEADAEAMQSVLIDFLTADSAKRAALIKSLDEGMTASGLRAYIKKAAANAKVSEARKKVKNKVVYRIDENGNKVRSIEKSSEQSIDSENFTDTGSQKPVSIDKTNQRELRAESYVYWKELVNTIKETTGLDILSEQSAKLLDLFTQDRLLKKANDAEAMVILNYDMIASELGLKSKSGVAYRAKKLQAELGKALGMSEAEVDKWLVKRENPTKAELADLQVRVLDAINKLQETKKPEPAPELPMPEPEKVADVGNRLLEDQAIEAKAETKAEEVPVPTAQPTEDGSVVETPLVKAEEPPVVRPDKTADALVSGEETMQKTSVVIQKKKTLSMAGMFTRAADAFDRLFEALSIEYPDETMGITGKARHEFVVNLLKEKGYDSIMDERGNIIPLAPIVPVGKVRKTTTKKIKGKTKEQVTLKTEDNNVPVVSIETVEAKPAAPTGPVETKPNTPEVPQPVKQTGPSELPKLPEAVAIERKLNDDVATLRNNGMDRKFLRLFSKKYWESKIEVGVRGLVTPNFKEALSQFVFINNFIAEANRNIFGENVMERFWAAVDKLSAQAIEAKMRGERTWSYRQILDKAAAEVSEPGKPAFVRPLLPEELKFIKDGDTVRLSAKTKKNRAIIDAAAEDKVKPPPVEKPEVPTPEDSKPASEVPEEPEVPKSTDEIIDAQMDDGESGTSRGWRYNSWVGRLIGGDDTASASWWRKQLASLANKIQERSKLGYTIRSVWDELRFVSRFADDGRAQTAHVVAQGTKPLKTMIQCKMDEGVRITRIWRAQSELMKNLKGADIKAVNEYLYDCLSTGVTPTKAELLSRKVSPRVVDQVIKDSIYMLDVARAINERMLYMETQTGRLISVDKDGAPLDPKKYAPVQFDHEALSMIAPGDHPKVIQAMTEARRQRKLNDPRLDKNTVIVLGWLGLEPNSKTKSYGFFSKDRTIKHSEAVNMFGNDTLAKLRRGADGKLLPDIAKSSIKGTAREVLKMLRNADPEKYFIIESDTNYTVHRVPEVLNDLGPTDAAKYIDAVKGNTAMYAPRWREWLNGRDLIQREMEEMFAFKVKAAPYGKENHGLTRPMFKIDPDGKVGLTVPGLTPEEMRSDPLLKGLVRTNLAEAYFHWLKGRYFELAFQTELDRVFGTTGITWDMVLERAKIRAQKSATKMAKDSGWTAAEMKRAHSDIAKGIQRLEDEYRLGADTLPYINEDGNLGARAASAALRYKFAVGYGVSQFTEMMMELTKEAPEFWRLPKNVFEAFRYVIGDRRFSKNKLLMSELGDLTFVLESLKTDSSNRFLGEFGYGTLTNDSPVSTGVTRAVQRFRDAKGIGEKLVSVLEGGGNAMMAMGSLGAQTQATRMLGKVRLQRQIWKYFEKNSIDTLLENLEKPENAAVLKRLQSMANKDQRMQVPLWKKFAGIARESGFGFDQHDAMMLMKYGFTDAESVRLFKWAMKEVGHDEGRVNIHRLMDLVDKIRREGKEGIDPNALERTISNYQFMLEDRITRDVASELRGLNRVTDLDTRTAGGRFWYALTSFIRSFHDNVLMNYGSKNTMKFLLGGIFMYGIYDAFTSLFKEYLAGRKADDILQEMEDHPTEFFLRGAARTPFFGVYSGFMEAGMSAASALNGGTYKFYGVPGMPGGVSAGMSALSNMYNDASKVVSADKLTDKIKAGSGLLGFTDVVNRSHAAIPIRLLEDMGAIEQQSAMETYLDLVHRNPYPYKKLSGKKTPQMDLSGYQAPPRNYALESEEYLKNLKTSPVGVRPVMGNTTSPTEGVSGPLGDLLDRAE